MKWVIQPVISAKIMTNIPLRIMIELHYFIFSYCSSFFVFKMNFASMLLERKTFQKYSQAPLSQGFNVFLMFLFCSLAYSAHGVILMGYPLLGRLLLCICKKLLAMGS